jgi:hypothetical protein
MRLLLLLVLFLGCAAPSPDPAGTRASVPLNDSSRIQEALWRVLDEELREQGVSLSDESRNVLQPVMEQAADELGDHEEKIEQAKAELAVLAQYIREDLGGPGIARETNAANAKRRWCPRYPFC